MKESLSLYEFNLLPEGEQYNIIFNKGQFLDKRLKGNKRYALYAVEKFFVEVEYDAGANSICGKVSFISGPKLDKYSGFNGKF